MRLITEDDDKDVESDAVSMDCDNDLIEPQIQLDLGPVVNVLTGQLSHKSIQTRIAVLRWVLLLHVKTPNKVLYPCYCFGLHHHLAIKKRFGNCHLEHKALVRVKFPDRVLTLQSLVDYGSVQLVV